MHKLVSAMAIAPLPLNTPLISTAHYYQECSFSDLWKNPDPEEIL